MSQPIVFYDIPGRATKDKAWSPNTWKTRYSLNYKGLAYKTVWVEYPDIEPLCKKIGAAPTTTKPDGSPHYTLPVIFDPNTNAVISESIDIARYLDKTYPATPPLIPPETDAFHAAFNSLFRSLVVFKMLPLMLPPSCNQLNPPSEAYFRRTREVEFGHILDEWSPPGPIRDGHWEEVKKGLTTFTEFLSADGKDKVFFMGERVTYADLTVAAFLVWIKRVLGSDGQEYGNVMLWDDGHYAKLMKALERYEVVI